MLSVQVLTHLLGDPNLRDLVAKVLAGQVKAGIKSLQVNAALSRRLLLNGGRSAEPGAPLSAEDQLLRDVLAEHLRYYVQVVDQNIAFSDRLALILRETDNPARTSQREGLTIQCAAPLGSRIEEAFRIRNNRSVSITAGFRISPFVSGDGTHSAMAGVVFDPPAVELGPGQERRIVVAISPAQGFEAEKTYLATISATGMETLGILVQLRVEPQQGGSAESEPAGGAAVPQAVSTAEPAAVPARPRSRGKTAPPTAPAGKAGPSRKGQKRPPRRARASES